MQETCGVCGLRYAKAFAGESAARPLSAREMPLLPEPEAYRTLLRKSFIAVFSCPDAFSEAVIRACHCVKQTVLWKTYT